MSLLGKTFVIFILLQPFLDFYFFYVPPLSKIFPFAISTIIRIIFTAVLAIFYLREKPDRKVLKWVLIYLGVCIVYFALHVLNARHFNSFSTTNFNFSLFGEAFYLIRMLIPVFIILLTTHVDFGFATFSVLTQTLAWIVSGSIVLFNLIKLSLASYGDGFISGNIFEWFTNGDPGSFYGFASKGFFYYANSISGVVLLLVPFILYLIFTAPKWNNLSLAVVQLLSCLMLGTKTAMLGYLALLFGTLLIFLFTYSLGKEKTLHRSSIGLSFLLLLIAGSIIPFSPMSNRSLTNDVTITEKNSNKAALLKQQQVLKRELEHKAHGKITPLMRYIQANYQEYSLNPEFVNGKYSYIIDPEFWSEVMKAPLKKRMDYRYLEKAMLDRVKKINNNHLDNWFGITYTRMNNIFNLERDFLSQWYSMGFFGVLILLGPMVFLTLKFIYLLLFKFKSYFNFLNASMTLAIVGIIGFSVYAGNILDFLTSAVLLAFFVGQTNVFFKHSDPKNKPLLRTL
ncbi:O-antigen ligase family protein [Xylocopilactobacillus apicola]|uniref:O-antigen ligase like membrane protein n=1 Tax=Xylocopilactobacillus apicola TaxID=2932184 RepID=A0AAU9DPX6_9LACO|nr:O-antigen ligase family protein [Xylocopilactobacillus apicola]BDR59247.1 hypothetical protein XA3_16880 [Xylocopilactobacillus apicola]